MRIVTCSKCGKDFGVANNPLYKRYEDGRLVYQCSYSCYRAEGGDDGRFSKSKLLQVEAHLPAFWKKLEK